jgi:L-rhamnose mutarotase
LLKENGIAEYSIFLDEETDVLFGFLKIENPEKLNSLPENAVMKKWWTYMKDIMETNPDESPISIPLQEVFFMP